MLVSEGISEVIAPLVKELGVDDYISNRLEYMNGEVTGKLLEPVIGGHDAARWVRAYAQEHGIETGMRPRRSCQGTRS